MNVKKNALFVLTSHGRIDVIDRETGFYYEELATPYWMLIDAGFEIHIASIKGGPAPADPSSIRDSATLPTSVKRFLADAPSVAKVNNTLAITAIDPLDYAIIFLPGGHGTMWDFSQSTELARVMSAGYEAGTIIGAVCHGLAGLLSARDKDGHSIVENKKINSFTHAEEVAVGMDSVVPFSLEGELRKLGALYENAENFQPYSVTDGQFVTGQNPASCELVAKGVLMAYDKHFNQDKLS